MILPIRLISQCKYLFSPFTDFRVVIFFTIWAYCDHTDRWTWWISYHNRLSITSRTRVLHCRQCLRPCRRHICCSVGLLNIPAATTMCCRGHTVVVIVVVILGRSILFDTFLHGRQLCGGLFLSNSVIDKEQTHVKRHSNIEHCVLICLTQNILCTLILTTFKAILQPLD